MSGRITTYPARALPRHDTSDDENTADDVHYTRNGAWSAGNGNGI